MSLLLRGNPMKGFMPNTDWTGTDILQEIPSSLEFHVRHRLSTLRTLAS